MSEEGDDKRRLVLSPSSTRRELIQLGEDHIDQAVDDECIGMRYVPERSR